MCKEALPKLHVYPSKATRRRGRSTTCAKSFCYLGDTLDGDGGADLAATARIRNGWVKFREFFFPFLTSRAPPLEMKGRVYVSCVRSSMTYGSEIRPLLVNVGLEFERAEMQMIRWMCGISMKDRRTNEERRPTEGACSMAVPDMSTRPRISALRMPSTHPAIRNANHR